MNSSQRINTLAVIYVCQLLLPGSTDVFSVDGKIFHFHIMYFSSYNEGGMSFRILGITYAALAISYTKFTLDV